MRKQEFHEFRVLGVRAKTAKAFCFDIEGLKAPVWVPFSQCEYDEDSETVHVSAWLVGQKEELSAYLKGQ